MQHPPFSAKPLVSVCMITFQHAFCIRQALDSVLVQQVDFPLEICLGEDGSTDGTREICQEYAAKYPDIIRLFLRDRRDPIRRQYHAVFMHNFVETLKACSGKYIALLEGDDCWLDPKKLHKQVDFLERHSEYSLCFSNGRVIYEQGEPEACPLYRLNASNAITRNGRSRPPPPETTTIGDLAQGNYIYTASVVFRNWIPAEGIPKWMVDMPVGDWPLYLCCATRGPLKYFPDPCIAYRMHSGGAWSTRPPFENMADLLSLYPPLLDAGFLPEPVKVAMRKTLPKRLFHLHRKCKEAGRLELYRKTMEVYFLQAPDVAGAHLELLHQKLERTGTPFSCWRASVIGRCVRRVLSLFRRAGCLPLRR